MQKMALLNGVHLASNMLVWDGDRLVWITPDFETILIAEGLENRLLDALGLQRMKRREREYTPEK